MIADELPDYLYARSTGHFASLMTLVTRGCLRAMRTGEERLTAGLLDGVGTTPPPRRPAPRLAAAIKAGLFRDAPRQPGAGTSPEPAR